MLMETVSLIWMLTCIKATLATMLSIATSKKPKRFSVFFSGTFALTQLISSWAMKLLRHITVIFDLSISGDLQVQSYCTLPLETFNAPTNIGICSISPRLRSPKLLDHRGGVDLESNEQPYLATRIRGRLYYPRLPGSLGWMTEPFTTNVLP